MAGEPVEHEYPFFSNRACRFFPCHADIDPEDFNCLFCYCPLYALGAACNGNYRLTKNGTKDCTPCSLPHRGDAGTRMVKEHFPELRELAKERMGGADTVGIADQNASAASAESPSDKDNAR